MALDDDADDPSSGIIDRYVDALGEDDAARLFLAAGGAKVYVPTRALPNSHAIVPLVLGIEGTRRLYKAFGFGYVTVPVARPWLSRFLFRKGLTTNTIATVVRANCSTVRRHVEAIRHQKPNRPDPFWQEIVAGRLGRLTFRPDASNDN